ncbi:THUMP domain-containing class I SAM-dependent RNA methyltransferase [Hyphobacterium marinum]|uniref:Class I SAM-dependent RNA methyltransferase n=1 Tax=Hyphobacterium marinum TaxID=3116574 RepID=A0ABU7LU34_9PROT|nr:class I SAM-dependent RNA methyltransferase [Hyphobacterium sp. Y6023]MEE2565068.1 class I SAM-dependent RNA methyltransferase [Hyphobacterium sp. Y6023]
MTNTDLFDIFLATAPGLEDALCAEAAALGFVSPSVTPGGVTIQGGWPDIWRANLEIRGANRVLARIADFRVVHLAQLDKLSRRVDWQAVLRKDVPVSVEVTCRGSKIYHARAAAQRIERAISEELGVEVKGDAPVTVRARIENNLCTISIDTSGELLHKRGFKEAVAKAPMRETMASLFLQECGYGGVEPVLDPMCGSGTFVIEAAEIAAGLKPGRARAFAFEHLATFEPAAWDEMRKAEPVTDPGFLFLGSDRNPAAVSMSRANARRAGVEAFTRFEAGPVSALQRPEGPPGLVIVNPPYGGRVGEIAGLKALYGAFGQAMLTRFSGWRVGVVTTDAALAKATRLPFGAPGRPVEHGGLKIRLWQTGPLP